MTASLFGIYTAQRSLSLNQAAIDLISNNISNMNTPGYSKQRVEIEQLTSGNISNIPQNACQDSLGAVISSISRNREAYLDTYFRNENSGLSYFKELQGNADLIENITNELDEIGINHSLDEFYESLHQLGGNPNDIVARNNVIQKTIELTSKFNSVYERLENLRTSIVGDFTNPNTLNNSKIQLSINELNNKLSSIADLNSTIILSTSQGTSPNYLLDQRDKLLDEVSALIPIDITTHSNGSVTVNLGNTSLVSGQEQTGFFEVTSGDINNPAIIQIQNGTGGTLVNDAYSLIDSGKIGAILEMGGSDANKLTIKSVMDDLDTLAEELATSINGIQTSGQYMIENPVGSGTYELSGDPLVTIPPDFFVDNLGATLNITAKTICLNSAILNDSYQIATADAASETGETGDGSNALLMAQVRDSFLGGLGGATTEQYITNLVGKVGSKTNTIKNNLDIKENVTQQVRLRRESVMGVNLDEEMTDLIKFQRSYEASAKIFSIVDQTIKTIINMVG
ncbi:MAG TPA: flagellar hook-associated protein FlgK [Candidatus Gastranaerophilales bacterium]|nr:flagellar hook-associated protein FlgK [Candidatus Gastranaerophilales bacterium]